MTPLTRGLGLLESAAGYALASTALVTPSRLSRATPCRDWDLAALLEHVTDSVDVLRAAIGTGRPEAAAGSGPVQRLRGRLVTLLGAVASAGPRDRPVAICDRELAASLVAVTGAVELTVHGWDIALACGADRPVPSGLATALLAVAPLLAPADARPGLFADPIPLWGRVSPSDALLAFLGRCPTRGDSGPASWSA